MPLSANKFGIFDKHGAVSSCKMCIKYRQQNTISIGFTCILSLKNKTIRRENKHSTFLRWLFKPLLSDRDNHYIS